MKHFCWQRHLMLFALFLVFAICSFAQTEQFLSGTVRNEKAEPMAGVTVTVSRENSNFNQAVSTAANGSFKVPVTGAGRYQVAFTYIGYTQQTQSVDFNGQSAAPLTITMQPGTGSIGEEVVVVGYGKTSKRDITGSVKSIKSGEFNRGIINSPQELLQGKVAGVNVVSASGEPGATQNITLRGPGGVRSGNSPLFVVDGVPLDNTAVGGATDPLSFINPQDIESQDVLKDASATAIYGTRGANGVILITTKRGKAGLSNLTYSFGGGMSKLARALPVFSATDFRREVAKLGNALQDFGGNTDWQKEITRTAYTQTHNISLSGGANKFTYFGSFNMQIQQGILKGNDLKRYTGRINLSQKLWDDRLTVDVNLSASNIVNYRPDIPGMIGAALSTNPTVPAYDSIGGPYRLQVGTNPLLLLAVEKDMTTTNRVLGNITGSLMLVKGLVYKLNFGVDNSVADRDQESLPNLVPLRLGRLVNLTNKNRNYLVENYLTYTGKTGEHRYTLLGGHSYQKIFYQGRAWSINNFPISGVEPIYNPGTGTELTLTNNRPSGYAIINELQSFFGRLNYAFNDKYLITATVRADGSTKFGANNKYGVFPSFSGAWVLTKEKFFQQQSVFTNVKLRGGWGQTGNQEIPSKITQALFQTSLANSYPLYPGTGYPTGTTYSRLANPDIQWEVSTQTDLGLDFDLLKGRLSGTVDVFRKVSNNILLEVIPADPVQPASTVWTNVPNMNIINKGLEVELAYRQPLGRNASLTVGGNATFISNVVKNSPYSVIPSGSASGSGLTSATINGYINGQPIGTFFLQEFIGISETTGLSRYRDINGDGLTNDKDRLPLGTALPRRTYNFYTNLTVKRFDLSANFNGVSGNKIYDNTANSLFYKALLAKGVNTTPAAIANPQEAITNAAPVSSRYLKDASFLRLNNLNIGYSFNTQALGFAKWVSNMRLSFTGQNLFVITPYDGYDPEVNTDRNIGGVNSYGIDYLSYPKARSFLVNFNVTF